MYTKDLGKITKKQLQSHTIIWVILIAYLYLDNFIPGHWKASLIGGAIIICSYLFTFYGTSLFIFPRYWEVNKIKLFICLLISLVIFQTIMYYCNIRIIPYFKGYSVYAKYSIWFLFSSKFFYFGLISSAGIAFYFYRLSIYKFSIQTKKEKELLTKELDFLKNQFNSHITFNFLNHCYGKIYRELPQTAESIELYSDILRYALLSKPNKKELISNEIENIQKFLRLLKIFNLKLNLTFNYYGDIKNKYVYPNIFIFLIEAVLKNKGYHNPGFLLDIRLLIEKNQLTFISSSTSRFLEHNEIKNFLETYCLQKYSLKEALKDNIFEIELTLADIDNE